MPELPEVETIRQGLSQLIIGKKILKVSTDSPKQVQPSLARVKKAIVGATIRKVERRAKLLLIFLSNKKILAIHLKLTGRLLVRKKGAKEDSWQHVIIFLSDNKELRLADLRKFGWIRVIKNKKELKKLLSEFGPEPLDDLDLETFKKILNSTKRAVKIVLMDQKKIAGVGNIYANDALFLAKIDPRRPANEITNQEAKKLLRAVEKVLRAGIKHRGASDQHYLDALGRKGSYQEHFLTYNRKGKKCLDCSNKIKKIKLGGRGTFYCPNCQK
jgi:formamidopyrimidine-DNA glycosylase